MREPSGVRKALLAHEKRGQDRYFKPPRRFNWTATNCRDCQKSVFSRYVSIHAGKRLFNADGSPHKCKG